MAQKARFPMEILRVTQGYGYSVDGVSHIHIVMQDRMLLILVVKMVDRTGSMLHVTFDAVESMAITMQCGLNPLLLYSVQMV